MNPAAEQPVPPPQPLQPHRSSFSCDRHPEEQFTGFCPSCLCERLTSLGPTSSTGASSSSRRPSNASLAATSSTAANALKAIFRLPTSTSTTDPGNKNGFKSSANNQKKNTSAAASAANASMFPELRRTKSFSASKNEGFSGVFEPQRHSCDVRGRSTLWSLFNQDDERKNGDHRLSVEVVEARNSVSSAVAAPVMESKEEDEEEEEEEEEEDEEQFIDVEDSGNEDEIRVSHASNHDIVRVSTSSNHDGIRISNYSNHDGIRISNYSNHDGARVSTSSNHDGIRISNYSNHDGARISTSSNHDGIRISNCSNHDATRVSNCSNHDAIRISTSSNLDGIRLSNYSYHDATRVSNCSNHDGIRVSNYSNLDELRIPKEATAAVGEGEIVEEENFNNEEVKTMKDHIDLDSQAKKKMGGNFTLWSAASVFSKKWQKWRQKQKKMKQPKENNDDAALPVDKPISRQFRETQSEVADYGFGRRSCDTDPRFSLDAGRISFDDPRYSFDEPRASWDGYLIGGSRGNNNFSRLPPILSVVEDSPVVHAARSDAHILVEQPRNSDCGNGDAVPGGTEQTREYYSDSSSRRRKSLDRSSSIRKTAAAVVAEIDELKGVSNAKVTPATVDLVGERELRHLNSISLRDNCLETFELGFRDNGSVVGNGGNEEGKGLKKSRRWRAWNIWGFIHRRNGGNKDEDDERYKYNGRGNGVERSFSESWQELRTGESNGEVKIGGFNRRVFRSNSSVSSRNSYSMGGSLGNVRKPSVEMNGNGKKRRDDFSLERNRSARYSPNHVDNGLLRFYLTPMRSNSRRGGLGKSKPNNTHSITRTLLRMY